MPPAPWTVSAKLPKCCFARPNTRLRRKVTKGALETFALFFWSLPRRTREEQSDAGWVHAQHEITLSDPHAMHGMLSGQHQSSAQLEQVPRSRRLRTSKLDRAFLSQRPEGRPQQPEDQRDGRALPHEFHAYADHSSKPKSVIRIP